MARACSVSSGVTARDKSASWSAKYSAMRPSLLPIGSTPAHTTSPLLHSASRSRAVMPRTRAGRMSFEQRRGGQRTALELRDGVEQRGVAAPRTRSALILGQEAAQHDRLDRLDLAPQMRERALAQRAQHLGVAQLVALAARQERARHQAARSDAARATTSATLCADSP